MPASTRIPALPAAARKAGATSITRCSAHVFSVGFAWDGEDHDAPGRGPAVVAALAARFGGAVSWGGRQADAIVLDLR